MQKEVIIKRVVKEMPGRRALTARKIQIAGGVKEK